MNKALTDESTFNREITPLKNLSDNYPKTILTLDRFTLGDYDGIDVVNYFNLIPQNSKRFSDSEESTNPAVTVAERES